MDRPGTDDAEPSEPDDGTERRRDGRPVPGAPDPESERRSPEADSDDPDPPWLVERAGQAGVYLGLVAVALAILGVVAARLRVQPLGNVAIVFSLATIVIAMVLATAFQAYVSDWPTGSN